jgi:RNA polymerase sigma-70 factor (ECF subfamily)
MAFLVVLQKLTPAERAVLLLHGAFHLDHTEMAAVLQKSEGTCCHLLSRARENVAAERRVLEASPEEHRRLLHAFAQASRTGELEQLMGLLAEDATFIVDTGPEDDRVGCLRDVGRPVLGAKRIAAFLVAVARDKTQVGTIHECMLNGHGAIVYLRDGRPAAAMLISVADGRIRHLFVQTDASRLGHLVPLH